MKNYQSFISSNNDGIFYLGHASILIKLSGKLILCDPVGYSDPYLFSWLFYPKQFTEKTLFDVDYVYVSHLHKDHFDIEFLKNLSKKTKILIMEGLVSFERELEHNNIKYTSVKNEQVTLLDDQIKMFGFVNYDNKVDSSAIFYNKNMCIYQGNDHWVNLERVQKFSKEIQKIDIACVPFAYIGWYPFCLKNIEQNYKKEESERLIKQCYDYAIKFIELINPFYAIPFGSNLVHVSDAYSEINFSIKTPKEFFSYALENHKEIANNILPLYSQDYISLENNNFKITMNHKNNYSRKKMNKFIEKNKNIPTLSILQNKFPKMKKENFVKLVENRIKNISNNFDKHQEIRIESHDGKEKFVIKSKTKECYFVDEWQNINLLTENLQHFVLDELASYAYFSGIIIFDDIVATRRVSLNREPNIYCQKTFHFCLSL